MRILHVMDETTAVGTAVVINIVSLLLLFMLLLLILQ